MAIKNLNLTPEEKLTYALEDQQAQARTKVATEPLPDAAPSAPQNLDHPIEPAVDQPVEPSIPQSTDRSTEPTTGQLLGPPLDRPVAFYLPKIIHYKIDEAVHYYQENHSKKVDRSAVVSALLADPQLWTHQSLDQLKEKVIRQLTYRLTSRLSS